MWVSKKLNGAGYDIGDTRQMPYQGDRFTDERNRTWLMQGLMESAADFPEAANVDRLKIRGTLLNNSTSILGEQAAWDGLNTYVIAYNDPTYVLVSVDGGNNFAKVAHNMGIAVSGMVYHQGKFIGAGCTASAMNTCWTVNGIDWAKTSANALATTTADTVFGMRGASNGTMAMFVAGGSTAAALKVTVNGQGVVANTGLTLPSAIQNSYIPAICAHGANVVYFVGNSTQAKMTADGFTFVNRTLPYANIAQNIESNGVVAVVQYSNSYYTTTDFISYTLQKDVSKYYKSSSGFMKYTGGEWRMVMDNYTYYTSTDAIHWDRHQIGYAQSIDSSAGHLVFINNLVYRCRSFGGGGQGGIANSNLYRVNNVEFVGLLDTDTDNRKTYVRVD